MHQNAKNPSVTMFQVTTMFVIQYETCLKRKRRASSQQCRLLDLAVSTKVGPGVVRWRHHCHRTTRSKGQSYWGAKDLWALELHNGDIAFHLCASIHSR